MSDFSDERIKECLAYCNEATEGPWEENPLIGPDAKPYPTLYETWIFVEPAICGLWAKSGTNRANSKFIARARVDLPAVLEALMRERLDHAYTVDVDDQLIAEARRERDELKDLLSNTRGMLENAMTQRDEAEALIRHLHEYWNGSENEKAMVDACHHVVDETEALLRKRGLLEAMV